MTLPRVDRLDVSAIPPEVVYEAPCRGLVAEGRGWRCSADFHPENVLVDGSGRVTGVIDWDGAGRGDADFDLVTLRFDLERRAPELGRGLDGLLPDGARAEAYWAHLALRQVDWAIRHFSAEAETWVGIAERLRP
ncbi:phosphotransferase family protein [Nonomuraea sediminis]|uniref:phosphotransferase family protein n=1 Tax=Nonomuraea sediminis TaxID=2835864 RepID=UPI0027DF30C1|nr:phosphotransferase [Nonomuraea sediminis]